MKNDEIFPQANSDDIKNSNPIYSSLQDSRFGIEFELYSGLKVLENKNSHLQRHDVLDIDPKTKTRIEISADRDQGIQKHIEFVTEPLKNIAELNYSILYIYEKLKNIIQQIKKQGYSQIGEYYLELDNPDRTIDLLDIVVPQMTTSIRLDDFEKVLNNIIHNGRGVWYTMLERLEELKQSTGIYKQLTPRVRGLVTIMLYVLACLQTSGSKFIEGPKESLSIMPRTDFKSMLASLDIEEQKEFYHFASALREKEEGKYVFTKLKYNNVYVDLKYIKNRIIFLLENNPNTKRFENILVSEWIDSIIDTTEKKDLLSPPPFYINKCGTTKNKTIYSMGATKLDPKNNFPIFEFRGFGSFLGKPSSRIESNFNVKIESNIFIKIQHAIQQILKDTHDNDIFKNEQYSTVKETLFLTSVEKVNACKMKVSDLVNNHKIGHLTDTYKSLEELLLEINKLFYCDSVIDQSKIIIETALQTLNQLIKSASTPDLPDQEKKYISSNRNKQNKEETTISKNNKDLIKLISKLTDTFDEIDWLIVYKYLAFTKNAGDVYDLDIQNPKNNNTTQSLGNKSEKASYLNQLTGQEKINNSSVEIHSPDHICKSDEYVALADSSNQAFDTFSSLFILEKYIDSNLGPENTVLPVIINAPENEGFLYHSLLIGLIETESDSGPVSSINRSLTYVGTDGNLYQQIYDPSIEYAKDDIITVNFGKPDSIYTEEISTAVNLLSQREPPKFESVTRDYSNYYK